MYYGTLNLLECCRSLCLGVFQAENFSMFIHRWPIWTIVYRYGSDANELGNCMQEVADQMGGERRVLYAKWRRKSTSDESVLRTAQRRGARGRN